MKERQNSSLCSSEPIQRIVLSIPRRSAAANAAPTWRGARERSRSAATIAFLHYVRTAAKAQTPTLRAVRRLQQMADGRFAEREAKTSTDRRRVCPAPRIPRRDRSSEWFET